MRFLGIDLAWADGDVVNETGVVALARDGTIADAGWTSGVEETAAWIADNSGGTDCVAFIDAPLLVLNEDRQRHCERQVGQRYGTWKVSANSTNRASPRLAGVRLREELEVVGWRYDDGTSGPPASGLSLSECYPYTVLVGAEELRYDVERPRYKRKPRRMPVARWRIVRAVACDDLIGRLSALETADPPLGLRSHPETATLAEEASPTSDRPYKHREDLIDACLAAWAAALWHRHGRSRCQVLGADDPLVDERGARATIIAPARPEQRRPSSTEQEQS